MPCTTSMTCGYSSSVHSRGSAVSSGDGGHRGDVSARMAIRDRLELVERRDFPGRAALVAPAREPLGPRQVLRGARRDPRATGLGEGERTERILAALDQHA